MQFLQKNHRKVQKFLIKYNYLTEWYKKESDLS